MFGKQDKVQLFFEGICEEYYAKVLQYLYSSLGDEPTARDLTQEVFLVALQKSALLLQHPNPGGFIFQTAKNLVKKCRRESFKRLLSDRSLDKSEIQLPDRTADLEQVRDREIDVSDYVERVLETLTPEKRQLYHLYYGGGKSMAGIAAIYGISESALRMRYVRLRREIQATAAEIAEKYFVV